MSQQQQQTVRFAPFRPFNDFIGNADDYGLPTFNDLIRWNNRITNNLLYYQSNYILVILIFYVIIGTLHPSQFLIGLITVCIVFVSFVMLTNRNVQMQRFKHNKPYLNSVILILLSGLILKTFGSLLVFLFSICMPITLIAIHASMRLRNIRNKIANKIEVVGLMRTPMGILLEQLGATNEIAS